MARYYLRPDEVYRLGVVRPPNASSDLHTEVENIALAFTQDPNTIAQQYGVATVPTAEPLQGYGGPREMVVGPTTQQPGVVRRVRRR